MESEWLPLSVCRARLDANLAVLAKRNPTLATQLKSACDGSWLISANTAPPALGRKTSAGIVAIPNQLSGQAIDTALTQLCPTGAVVEPVMVVGLDGGLLWEAIFNLPCNAPLMAGHRPPLYLLVRDPAQLAAALHTHDWTTLLADSRVLLFAGPDATQQCYDYQLQNPRLAICRLTATLDATLWPARMTADSMLQEHVGKITNRVTAARRRLDRLISRIGTVGEVAITANLRVFGITSRYTTFLQHSMRDWMAGLQELGHDTRISIESGDHEVSTPLSLAQDILEFKPDLIVMIDHFRGELDFMPPNIPCAMWVQDRLPTIFTASAGRSQGGNDYCLGFGKQILCQQFEFPRERFLPAPIGVNATRFSPRSDDDQTYDCELSFVSHASTPAAVLLDQRMKTADAPIKKLLGEVFDWLCAIYSSGEAITHPILITRRIDAAIARDGLPVSAAVRAAIDDLFTGAINNALFRHQALQWAADLGLNLQLWGRGWDQHPTLSRFAKGVADNQTDLLDIYQRSAINLQIVPTGAVHQRMLDGLAAGGFFLSRPFAGDFVEPHYERLWKIGQRSGWVCSDDTRRSAQPTVLRTLQQIEELLGVNPFDMHADLFDEIQFSAAGNFTRSAASVWQEYSQIAFSSPRQLQQKVTHYLKNPEARRLIAHAMRKTVIDRFSYRTISQNLLDLIQADRAAGALAQAA